MVNIENTTFRKNLFVILYIVNFYYGLFTLTEVLTNPSKNNPASHSKNPYAIVKPNRVFNDQININGAIRTAISAAIKIRTNVFSLFIVYLT